VVRPTARFLVAIVVFAGIGVVARAGEPASAGVVDEVGQFRPETAARAGELIRGLQRDYHFDVCIETIALSPADLKNIERMTFKRSRDRYFAELARERAEKAKVNGLYVLVCTNTSPPRIQVTVFPISAEALFSRYQQRQLETFLADRLQNVSQGAGQNTAAKAAVGLGWQLRPPSKADAALLAALDRVAIVLRERAGDPNAVQPAAVGVMLGAVAGMWLVLTLLRRRMAERNPNGGLFSMAQPGGRPALLAAQFGTPAGHWVYDRLFFGHSANPPAMPTPVTAERAEDATAQSDLLHPEPDPADAATHDGTG
jgi:hypothetical protein